MHKSFEVFAFNMCRKCYLQGFDKWLLLITSRDLPDSQGNPEAQGLLDQGWVKIRTKTFDFD